MKKNMSVEELASIKGAKPSKSINQLFDVIQSVELNKDFNNYTNPVVEITQLRDDIIIDSSANEKQLILENFPQEKNGFLVVPKIIED